MLIFEKRCPTVGGRRSACQGLTNMKERENNLTLEVNAIFLPETEDNITRFISFVIKRILIQ